jgi:hypothetical protein
MRKQRNPEKKREEQPLLLFNTTLALAPGKKISLVAV